MRCITDTKQTRLVPVQQTIDGHRQQFDRIPILQFINSIAQEGCHARNVLSKLIKPALFECFKTVLRNYKAALPVVTAIQHHHDLAAAESPQHLIGIAFNSSNSKPQHVDRSTKDFYFETGAIANDGMPS